MHLFVDELFTVWFDLKTIISNKVQYVWFLNKNNPIGLNV